MATSHKYRVIALLNGGGCYMFAGWRDSPSPFGDAGFTIEPREAWYYDDRDEAVVEAELLARLLENAQGPEPIRAFRVEAVPQLKRRIK